MKLIAHKLADSDLSCLQHKAAKRLPESTDSRAAQLLLDKLCALYYDKKARYTDSQRYEKLRYDMLIAAIDGALPEHSSAMVCTCIMMSSCQNTSDWHPAMASSVILCSLVPFCNQGLHS